MLFVCCYCLFIFVCLLLFFVRLLLVFQAAWGGDNRGARDTRDARDRDECTSASPNEDIDGNRATAAPATIRLMEIFKQQSMVVFCCFSLGFCCFLNGLVLLEYFRRQYQYKKTSKVVVILIVIVILSVMTVIVVATPLTCTTTSSNNNDKQ